MVGHDDGIAGRGDDLGDARVTQPLPVRTHSLQVGLDPALMQADGLHPTAAGQRRLAERLVPHVAELLGPVD